MYAKHDEVKNHQKWKEAKDRNTKARNYGNKNACPQNVNFFLTNILYLTVTACEKSKLNT